MVSGNAVYLSCFDGCVCFQDVTGITLAHMGCVKAVRVKTLCDIITSHSATAGTLFLFCGWGGRV